MNSFHCFITCKRTNNANNATHYVKLGKKRRESSKHTDYIIFSRVIQPVPEKMRLEMLAKCKSKSSMVKIQVSIQMSYLKRDL